ncbi:MAG: acetyl-CoA carboxylase biotin carboxyl carrier protein [Phycisphaerales bacterium]|jgi:acetyl-CoA carboxylase biotin carboxyl carrier protein|nr:acetyl-CoA carboxylase biotin carboxyl carrier protein [Phycisphaerales bacterium]MBT7171799.1 acetyl-CoA carboxylase biotin carboxyl carrier protein [Phycisphaerales bacterium]
MAKKPTKKPAKKATKKKAPKKASPKKRVAKKAPKGVAKKKAPAKKPAPTAPANKKIADVEHLMLMMAEYGVTELNMEDGKNKIELKRGTVSPVAVGAPVIAPAVALAAAPVAAAPAATPADAPAVDDGLVEITSPMVGTFYAAPSPDSPDFAKVGDTINDSSVVCIVEAMKVMNEIEAECSGTIAEVCVKKAEPVEFGQVLFKVKPA